MSRYCLPLLLALVTPPAFGADELDIRELMTAEEFAASGLSQLSDAEFDVVNQWLLRFSSQTAAEIVAASPVEEAGSETTVFRSRIDGAFTGWNGPTRFPLKNGQVWETNSTRRYSYSATDPEVEITRNWIGSYRMRLLDTDKSINVKRIQ